MVIRNRLFALLYRCVAFGIIIYTLVLLLDQPDVGISLCYFTNQSNILLAVLFGLMIVFNAIDLRHGIKGVPAGAFMPLSMAILLYICITGIVYNGILVPFQGLGYDLALVMGHVVTPLLAILDWVLFEEKGTIRWWHGFYWLVYPIFYCVFILVRPIIWQNSFFGDPGGVSKYPYFFLDANKIGWGMVFLWIGVLIVAFFGMSELLIFLNNLIAGKYRKRGPIEPKE